MKINSKYIILVVFLILNFGALSIGSYLMNNGPSSVWYLDINKAPWTPPGWVFGVAWTTIMICFSIYMTSIYNSRIKFKRIAILFALQWILNVSWNPIFFNDQHFLLGLVVLILLTTVLLFILKNTISVVRYSSFWLAPYLIWMLVAISLNAYIYLYN